MLLRCYYGHEQYIRSYKDFHFCMIGKEMGTVLYRARIIMFILSATACDMYHVPDFIRKYSNIKQFSCQGKLDSCLHMDYMFIGYMFAFLAVEKKNDICKATYFKSSNK